jgi:hypothetical protein
VADGIVSVIGLDIVRYGEMIIFSNREIGVVLSLESLSISAIILGSDTKILPGDFVFRTAKLMGVYASGALLGSVVNPLGKRLSKNKVNTLKTFGNKYITFKDLFSIFFIDNNSFKQLLITEINNGNFELVNNSFIKESYMVGFMADYAKLLNVKKALSIFKNVKEFFKLADISLVKTVYNSQKLLSLILDSKVDSANYNK